MCNTTGETPDMHNVLLAEKALHIHKAHHY